MHIIRYTNIQLITTFPQRGHRGPYPNICAASHESQQGARISYRITTVARVARNQQINYNCFNEPFTVARVMHLNWNMHGLIFETSIWLLAGSTRLLCELTPSVASKLYRHRSELGSFWKKACAAFTTSRNILPKAQWALRALSRDRYATIWNFKEPIATLCSAQMTLTYLLTLPT